MQKTIDVVMIPLVKHFMLMHCEGDLMANRKLRGYMHKLLGFYFLSVTI